MNWGRLRTGTTLAASVMILVTFAPESALAPFSNLFTQLRQNNVSAMQEKAASNSPNEVEPSVVSKVAKSLKGILN